MSLLGIYQSSFDRCVDPVTPTLYLYSPFLLPACSFQGCSLAADGIETLSFSYDQFVT